MMLRVLLCCFILLQYNLYFLTLCCVLLCCIVMLQYVLLFVSYCYMICCFVLICIFKYFILLFYVTLRSVLLFNAVICCVMIHCILFHSYILCNAILNFSTFILIQPNRDVIILSKYTYIIFHTQMQYFGQKKYQLQYNSNFFNIPTTLAYQRRYYTVKFISLRTNITRYTTIL